MSTAAELVAQTPSGNVAKTDSTTLSRAWLSLGLGGGSDGLAGRAAASIAVTSIAVLTVDGIGVGGFDGGISSINLMVGAQSSDPTGFVFASGGLANVSCGSGCPHQTGIALEAGYHGGWRNAGGGVAAFIIRAPGGSNFSGVVATFDIGRFGPPR